MRKGTSSLIEEIVPKGIIRLGFLVKAFLNSKTKYGLNKYIPEDNHQIIVLGNGPSLKTSINRYAEKLVQLDLMAVNQFATTQEFCMLKPKYYVLADPDYYEKETRNQRVLDVIEALVNKVAWSMVLFVSEKAIDSELYNQIISRNKKITFFFYSSTRVRYEYLKKKDLFKLLGKDMIEPPSQTVLNTCIAICINYKFNNIYILGADTSWHEQYIIDQQTNDLFIQDNHFYGTEKVLYKRHNDNLSNLAEEFRNISRAFNYYQLLKEYAITENVNIYNASEISWIDVFDRKEIV